MGKRHAGKTGGGSLALGARARQPCVAARSFGAPLTFRLLLFFSTTTTSLCADCGTRLFQGGRSAGAEEGRSRFGTEEVVTSGIHDEAESHHRLLDEIGGSMGGVGANLQQTLAHFNKVFVENKNGRQFCFMVGGMTFVVFLLFQLGLR